MGSLTAIMLVGGYAYYVQANEGLVVTGMNDHVSWGLYISNMAFLVGRGGRGGHPGAARLCPA